MTPFEMGASSGMEKTAATRALKELRKIAPGIGRKGSGRHVADLDQRNRLGHVWARIGSKRPWADISSAEKKKIMDLHSANYKTDRDGYRPGAGWRWSGSKNQTHDALTRAQVNASPGEINNAFKKGFDEYPELKKKREGIMREALKNPNFSYSRDRSSAADKVRARAKAMGLNK